MLFNNSFLSTFAVLATFLCSTVIATTGEFVNPDKTIRGTDEENRPGPYAVHFSGQIAQSKVPELAAAKGDGTKELNALAQLAASAMAEMHVQLTDPTKRPKMMAALLMNIDDSTQKIYLQSSLKGTRKGAYSISPPLHPSLVSTFDGCAEEARPKTEDSSSSAATQEPAPDADDDGEGFTVVVGKRTKQQAARLLNAKNGPKKIIDKYSNHGNSAACAEVLAMNKWLNDLPNKPQIKTLQDLQDLLKSDTYLGKKRIITVNAVNNDVKNIQVADPCSVNESDPLDPKMWGCQEWLELAGFDNSCEIGHRPRPRKVKRRVVRRQPQTTLGKRAKKISFKFISNSLARVTSCSIRAPKKAASPAKNSPALPAKKGAAPAKKGAAPAKKGAAPAKKVAAPAKKVAAPAKLKKTDGKL